MNQDMHLTDEAGRIAVPAVLLPYMPKGMTHVGA